MSPLLSVALFFVIWWMTLFAILPIGVKSQYEGGEVVPGSEGAAPQHPMLLRKAALTTIVAAVVFACVYFVISDHLFFQTLFNFGPASVEAGRSG
jgi:predicted secreted protein